MRTLALICLAAVAWGADYPKLSPFEALRWNGEAPEVMVGGAWYALVSLNGIDAGEIARFCRKTYEERWRKRFGEDLVQVLTEMGRAPDGGTADLVVKDAAGATKRLDGVAMTAENRKRIRDAGSAPAVERVERDHSSAPREEFAALARRLHGGAGLAAQQAAEDLDQLEWAMEQGYSYLNRGGVDYR
ncbi:MAG: hypothetical protein ACREID_02295, partial [Planctomycetota bacterium]